MTAEHSSEEGGEGLSEWLKSGERAVIRIDARWAREIPVMNAVDRLAARAESAEAERDDLRGRLAAVEAELRQIADEHEAVMDSILPMPNRAERDSGRKAVRRLRAAIANPSAAQGEGEGEGECCASGRCEVCSPGLGWPAPKADQ